MPLSAFSERNDIFINEHSNAVDGGLHASHSNKTLKNFTCDYLGSHKHCVQYAVLHVNIMAQDSIKSTVFLFALVSQSV